MVPFSVARYLKRVHPPKRRVVTLSDKARAMGALLAAGKGSGKSRLMGRVICWQDFLKGRGQVILDPNGPTIDNLLDKIARLPASERASALKRIVYVDMGGTSGHVLAWPLYYRYPSESLYEAAQRLVEVIRRLDPALASASIEGFNAIAEVGTYFGMVAAALSWQITKAPELIAYPERFTRELEWVAQTYPEARQAADYFLEVLPNLKSAERERRVGSFLRKIAPFTLDPVMRATVGAATPSIDWERVVAEGKTVLLDFRGVIDSERRRFLMLWTFRSFLTFIKRRGAGRHAPIGLVVDELTALYNYDAQAGSSIFAADLDELINVLARNCQVWLLLALQELYQIDERSRKTLLTMGTKILGVTTDSQAALTLAQELLPYDPKLIKYFEPVYNAQGIVVDASPVYWSIQEQQLLAAARFQTLKPFHFLVKLSEREGDATGNLEPLSIAGVDPGIWVDEAAVGRLRAELAAQAGVPVSELLSTQAEQALPAVEHTPTRGAEPAQTHEEAARDRLEAYESEDTDDLSLFRERYEPGSY